MEALEVASRTGNKQIASFFHAGDQYIVEVRDDGLQERWVKVHRSPGPATTIKMSLELDHLQALRLPTKFLSNHWVEHAISYLLKAFDIRIHQGTGDYEAGIVYAPIWISNEHDLDMPSVENRLREEMARILGQKGSTDQTGALLLSVNTTGPQTAPHHTLKVRWVGLRTSWQMTVDSLYGPSGVHQQADGSFEVRTKTQADGWNCGLHVVKAAVLCASVFLSREDFTPQRIYEHCCQPDRLAFLLQRAWWLDRSTSKVLRTTEGVDSPIQKRATSAPVKRPANKQDTPVEKCKKQLATVEKQAVSAPFREQTDRQGKKKVQQPIPIERRSSRIGDTIAVATRDDPTFPIDPSLIDPVADRPTFERLFKSQPPLLSTKTQPSLPSFSNSSAAPSSSQPSLLSFSNSSAAPSSSQPSLLSFSNSSAAPSSSQPSLPSFSNSSAAPSSSQPSLLSFSNSSAAPSSSQPSLLSFSNSSAAPSSSISTAGPSKDVKKQRATQDHIDARVVGWVAPTGCQGDLNLQPGFSLNTSTGKLSQMTNDQSSLRVGSESSDLRHSGRTRRFDDPIELGLVALHQAMRLVDLFHHRLQPCIALLDPAYHTFDLLRSRSTPLLTAILTASAQFFEPNLWPGLSMQCHQVLTSAMSAGICDVGLIQALCIRVYWRPPTDNSAFLKIGHAVRMAYQLGLHLPRRSSMPTDMVEVRSVMDKDRTWLYLCCFGFPWVELDLLIRLVIGWSLQDHDAIYSMWVGRPSTILSCHIPDMEIWFQRHHRWVTPLDRKLACGIDGLPILRNWLAISEALFDVSIFSHIRESLARHHRELTRQYTRKWIDDRTLHTWPIPPRAYEVSSLVILNQAVQAEAVLAGITQVPSNMSEVLMTADKLVVNLSQLALDDGLLHIQDILAVEISTFIQAMIKVIGFASDPIQAAIVRLLLSVRDLCDGVSNQVSNRTPSIPSYVARFISRYLSGLPHVPLTATLPQQPGDAPVHFIDKDYWDTLFGLDIT